MELNSIMEDSPLNGRRRNHPWKQKRSFSNNAPGSPVVVSKKTTKPWQQFWSELERTLGMHGIRRVKPKRRNIVASIIWTILLLFVAVLFVYSMVTTVLHYLNFSTLWTMERTGGAALNGWPAISICNLGPVRITKLKEHYLSERERRSDRHVFNWTTFVEDYKNTPSRELYTNTAHQIQDMLLRCDIRGTPCSAQDFYTTLSEEGLCYTLQPDTEKESVGFWLNAETYDSLPDVQQALGFKIYIHNDESPVETDHYFYVSPGHQYDITVAKESLELLPHPYGICMQSDSALYNKHCHSDCTVQHIQAKCGCLPFWVSSDNNEQCSIKSHFSCVQKVSKEKSCMCHHGCLQEYHFTDITSVVLSDAMLSTIRTDIQESVITKKYESALNITYALYNDSTEVELIENFNNASFELINSVNRFASSLNSVKETLHLEKENMDPRITFHTKVALGGMIKTIKEGFSPAWRALDEGYLNAITLNSLELMAMFERTVQLLKSDRTERTCLYTTMDTNFAVKTDIADVILNNLTSIHMSYLNAEPTVTYRVTPQGRYDSSLIPSELITRNRNSQTIYYDEFAGVVGKYIQEIVTMQNILREVHQSRSTDDVAANAAKNQFTLLSSKLNQCRDQFRDSVIAAVELEMKSKIDNFKKLGQDYEVAYSKIISRLDLLLQFVNSVNTSNISRLKQVTNFASSYISFKNVTKSNFILNTLSDDMETMIGGLNEVTLEIIVRLNEIFVIFEEYDQALYRVWESILSEDALSGFYFHLQDDVKQIQQNSAQTQALLDIFTDERMLNISHSDRSASELMLSRLSLLLNADVPVIHLSHKQQGINISVQNYINSINFKTVVHQNIQSVQQNFETLQLYLDSYRRKISLDKSFQRENLLHVKLQHSSHYHTNWKQLPAYSLSTLFAKIGMFMACFMGASVLTCLEFCDILMCWLMDRDCCKGSKLQNQSSDDTSNKSYDALSRPRVNRTPSYTTDSLQSRDTLRESSRDYNKRPYVKFQDCNHIRGSEV